MPRPLKFRYYREDLDKMIMSDDHASLRTFFAFYEMAIKAGDEPSDLMQFTGLSDQEGKDIYDRDILEWESIFLEVTYSNLNACFNAGCDMLTKSYGLYSSVGGNVFENPELLDKL